MENENIELVLDNKVILVGEVLETPKLSHKTCNEEFYLSKIAVKRLSGDTDILEIVFSEKTTDISKVVVGKLVKVEGEIRSYNYYVEELKRRKLLINVFVKQLDEVTESEIATNEVTLIGHICKEPIYRTTPFGREIADILLAVNRLYGKSDYLPCIAWGRNAKFASKFLVGDKIRLTGRIQSREYTKKVDDKEIVKIAYEISVAGLEKLEKEKEKEKEENKINQI